MGSLTTAAVAALLFLSFSSGSLGAALADERFPPVDEEALINTISKGMTAQRQPGLIAGIWVPGRGSLVRAFGTSDLASNAPMQLDDHVRIASITKTFTGVAILQLVDEGWRASTTCFRAISKVSKTVTGSPSAICST